MITNWNDLEQWIRDNNLSRWIFTKSNRDKASSNAEGGTPNDKLVDSDFYPESMEEKLAITRRILEQQGRLAYGYGWQGGKKTDGVCCEVLLSPVVTPAAGVGAASAVDIAGMEDRIRKQIKAEMDKERYERERKDFEKEKKQFEEDKQGVMGLLVGYLAPVAKTMMEKGRMPHIGTVDAEADVQAKRIEPATPEGEAPVDGQEVESPFTEEEEDKIYDLMVRFKAAEPDCIQMLETVVGMAESGDAMYKTAKNFLIK